MGWTVLYIAFGVVALWLLGEVLLQYKARLRWRLLAFAGFLGVVLGVLIPSVLVIALGAIAFATGQTYVTLSFRRGFSTGWAIGGSPGESRRRRAAGDAPGRKQPTLEVSGLEYQEPGPEAADETAASAVYEPQPLPDDTGQYGIYTDAAYAAAGSQEQQGEQQQYAAYDPYTDYAQPAQDTYSGQGAYQGQGAYPGQETYQGQDTYAGQYDYGTPTPDYAPYSDPYIGTGAATGPGQYTSYDSYGNGYDSYGGQQQYTGPYAEQYAPETPPGGVWVPQQREGEQYPPLPPEQPAPYGNGYDTGQNEQYRY
ncbi:hypothetical protein [Streptomyces sp. NPDC056452]|uniref:hypothetical protein n=1 Tax=Streptomyces sp. NPDC056452 TaxID=3345821 RepID=UPI0036A9710B